MKLSDLYEIIDEIKSLEYQLNKMCESCSDNGIDSALADPGLQYEIEREIENKLLTIKELI